MWESKTLALMEILVPSHHRKAKVPSAYQKVFLLSAQRGGHNINTQKRIYLCASAYHVAQPSIAKVRHNTNTCISCADVQQMRNLASLIVQRVSFSMFLLLFSPILYMCMCLGTKLAADLFAMLHQHLF